MFDLIDLTKDQQELVSLLRQIGYELSPSTYTDINGLIGFDVSGGFHVAYSLNHQNSNVFFARNFTFSNN